MKHILLLMIILSSLKVTAQNSPVSVLQVVLTDSDVAKYISEYGKIDTSSFVLSGDSGDFVLHHGTVDFQAPDQENPQQYAGIIKKIKVSHAKSVVKIYFNENNKFITKVKLERYSKCGSWHVKSRLIRRKFKDRKNQPGLFYFSYN